MGWFRRSKPDMRPASDHILAIARSLSEEPHRWSVCADARYIAHDNGIEVDAFDFWVSRPWIADSGDPDADRIVIKAAIQKWIEKAVSGPTRPKTHGPPPPPTPEYRW